MRKVITKRIRKIGLLIGFLLLIYFVIQSEGFSILRKGDIDSFQLYLNKNLPSALFFMLLFMIIQNSVTIIPLVLLVTVNVIVFGFLLGFVWSYVTSIIGCLLVFIVTRYWLHDVATKRLNDRMKEKIEKNGFVFVFISRIFPILPTSIINIAAAVSTISMKHYLLGTLLGNFIFIFALSLIPLGIMSEEAEHYIFILLALFIVIGVAVYRRRKKRQQKGLF